MSEFWSSQVFPRDDSQYFVDFLLGVFVLLVRSVLVAFSFLNHLSAGVPGAWHSKVGFHGSGGQSPIIKIIYCTSLYSLRRRWRETSLCVYIYIYLQLYAHIASYHKFTQLICTLHMDTSDHLPRGLGPCLILSYILCKVRILKIATYLLFWTDSVCQPISWYDNSGYWES